MTLIMGFTSCKCKSKTVENETTAMIEEKTPSNIMINDIWALQSMEGSDYNPQKQTKGVKIPTLEFQVSEMRYGGNDGCNSIFGTIKTITTTELIFTNGGATRMFCAGDEVSPVFNKHMGEVAGYKIEKLTLSLLDASGNVLMTFKKVD